MSLSQNIKRFRLEKNLTQEQLAASLGISPQAVSKWETSETHPDGALLVPLANKLEVSLDELFDNESVTMKDLSGRIMRLLRNTGEEERLNIIRDMGWHIQSGLFSGSLPEGYDVDEIKRTKHSSYIQNNYGFTMISNGHSPFFFLFTESESGLEETIGDGEDLRRIFQCLSSPETMGALIYLYKKKQNYVFESAVLACECHIGESKIQGVMEDLLLLRVVTRQELSINGENHVLYYSHPHHRMIALFLIAHEFYYRGAYSLTALNRTKPFLK